MPTRTPLLALAVILGAHLGAKAQPRPEYGIREDQPRTGSMIRRQMVGPTAVSVNLSWEQLPPGDRAKFKENYEAMPPGDEPPFPTGGLKAILDPVRKAQSKLLVTGDLFLVAKIDPTGVAEEIAVYGSPSPEMTKFASQVLLLAKFKPAVCSGQPCAMEFPLRMHFRTE